MPCKKPYMQGSVAFPCGQCLPCRLQRQYQWAHRIILEAEQARDAAFITLTYEDKHIPILEGTGISDIETRKTIPCVGNLVPEDLQKWLKRLRKELPFPVRFFACGEYGGIKHRPHFHAIIFGLPPCRRGRTLRHPGPGNQPTNPEQCCSICRMIKKTWPYGLVDCDAVNFKVARYVARYTVKKLNGPAEELYQGRHPEFARMSLKNGGIGSGTIPRIAEAVQYHGLDEHADVPRALRHGSKIMPLDKYMRRLLRVSLGRKPQCPDEISHALSLEMQPLLETSRNSTRSVKSLLLERDEQKIRNIEAKSEIFKHREKL